MDKFLRSNMALRIVALVLSCFLWLIVSAQGSPNGTDGTASTREVPYPVHVLVDPNLTVTAIDNPTAVISVHGDAATVATLTAQMLNVTVQADARGLSAGRHVLPLSATGMPPVTYSINPTTVTVVIDKKVTAQREVQVQILGKPANGYDVGTPVTDLQVVDVSGVQSAVDKVAYVDASVSVQQAKQSVTKAVNLRPMDKDGHIVSDVDVNPVNVTVTIPIQSPEVTMSVAPQIVGSPVAGYAVADVQVSPSVVQVQGNPSVTSTMQSVSVPVDVTGFRDTQTVHVQLPLQQGLTKVAPSTITVTVKVETAATKSFDGVPITVRNLPSSLRATVNGPDTVNVTLSGPKSVIDGLQTSDISAYIDGSQLKSGANTVPLNVSVPDWVQVTQMSNHTVQVDVSPSGQ